MVIEWYKTKSDNYWSKYGEYYCLYGRARRNLKNGKWTFCFRGGFNIYCESFTLIKRAVRSIISLINKEEKELLIGDTKINWASHKAKYKLRQILSSYQFGIRGTKSR